MVRQCGTGKLWESTAVERGLADLSWGTGYDTDTIKRAHVGPLFPFEEVVCLKPGDLVYTADGDPCRLAAHPGRDPSGEARFVVECARGGSFEAIPRTESGIVEHFSPWPGFVRELAKREAQYLA